MTRPKISFLFSICIFIILFSLSSFSLTVEQCPGCIVEENCVLPGVSRLGSYCDLELKEMVLKKEFFEDCLKDFECISDKCVADTCSKVGFFDGVAIGFKSGFHAATNADGGVLFIDGKNASEEEDIPREVSEYGCVGCKFSGNCLPYGWRDKSQYCAVSGFFRNQRKPESECTWNYQCEGGKCTKGACGDIGFIKRFFQYLERIF